MNNETKTALAQSQKWSIKIGDTLHVVLYGPGDEESLENTKKEYLAKARTAMLNGGTAVIDGVTQWIEDAEHYPFVWHEDGVRSRHTRYHHYKDQDDNHHKVAEKDLWLKAEDA